MKTLITTLALLTSTITIQAQSTIYGVEWDAGLNMSYLSSVNPNNGNILRISSLSGVANEYTAQSTSILNSSNETYTFATYLDSSATISSLYNVDINTGSVVSNPLLSSPIRELNYDGTSGNYYAIEFEDTTAATSGGMTSTNDNGNTTTTGAGAAAISGVYYTVNVNVTTGAVNRIASIAGVTSISTNNSTYNALTSQFVFVDNNDVIYTINISDGSIASSATLSASIQELHVNPATGIYYGLKQANGGYDFVTLNPSTGLVTTVATISGLSAIKICTSTLDHLNDVFSISNDNDELYNINLNTGVSISKPVLSNEVIGLTVDPALPAPTARNSFMPNPVDPRPNGPISIGGFERVKAQETEEQLNRVIAAYPNPALNQITIEAATNTKLSIYNIAGVLVKEVLLENEISTINIEDLENGLHYFNLSGNGKSETKRIIVQ